jgi:hypothetical protein
MPNDPDDQFAIVRVPPPGLTRNSILHDAIMVGNLNAVLEQLPSTRARADAIQSMYRVADSAVEAEQRRDAARDQQREAEAKRDTALVQRLSDAIGNLSARIDAMEEYQARQVAADKARRIRDALSDLPGHVPDGDGHEETIHATEGGLSPLLPPAPHFDRKDN